MTGVKICGLRSTKDAELVNKYRPDYAGVILAKGFRRSVSLELAKEIRQVLVDEIPLVGVFVNDEEDTVLEAVKDGIIQVIQLHGQEDDAYVRDVKETTAAPVWKVFQMREDVATDDIEHSSADMVLLDAGTGAGESFDWHRTENVKRPFVLAGGLTPDNVAKAMAQTNAVAVDTSSGVETDGSKDEEKIEAFIRAVRKGE